MVCCANTFPRVLTLAGILSMSLTLSRRLSTTDLVKHLIGKHLLKLSKNYYFQHHKPVLRRPLEPKQYVSIRYTERLADAGIEPSVGSVGDSYDNAMAETVIGLFKTEVIRRRGPWRQLEAVEFATLEWVDWFNHRRLLEPIGHIPPAEREAMYYEQQSQANKAA
tara:strand:- start:85 stop:579 length:495 start_codon:yes stop_codon:yes gene_type:complete